ncbi:MAG TPA: histidine phosphatase family protein [Polyangiaceae bacterium]|jgi:phosphohistidine phosphatase|nr:histidine phosphatase family protein [Polyangiaceae bacterium]
MKIAILMRHAEAEKGTTDFDRALTVAGRGEARTAARQMAQSGVQPDWVIASAAVRAQQTAELVRAEFPGQIPLVGDATLYEGDVDSYLAVLRGAPASKACVLLIAHNPTLSSLAQRLGCRTPGLSTGEWVKVESSALDWVRFGT